VLIVLLSIVVVGVSAGVLAQSEKNLDGYFYFTPLAIAVSGLTILSLITL
jgi:hypothetical protein